MSNLKLWFGDYENHYNGEGRLFLSGDDVEMIRKMESLYPKILDEVSILWNNSQKNTSLYGDFDAFDDKQYPPNSWKKLVIKVWNLYNLRVENYFPILFNFVQSHPEISSCFITKTLPNSYIKPHCGETNGILRLHLGLKIPSHSGEMCSIKMDTQIKDWEEGKAFGFIDAQQHEVWNKTNEERYILIIDVIRPEFRKLKNYICVRIITTQLLFFSTAKFLGEKYIEKIPDLLITILSIILYLPIIISTYINNRFGLIKI